MENGVTTERAFKDAKEYCRTQFDVPTYFPQLRTPESIKEVFGAVMLAGSKLKNHIDQPDLILEDIPWKDLILWAMFKHVFVRSCFFGLDWFWGQSLRPNFPSPWTTMLALRLDCSTAALTTHQKVLHIWKLVALKTLDFSDHMRTGISILTSAGEKVMFKHIFEGDV